MVEAGRRLQVEHAMPRAVRRPYGPRATDESRRGTGTAPQSKKSRGRCATAEPRRGSSRQTFDRCGSASYKSGPPDEGGSRARLENLRCETSRALCVAVQSGRLPCGQVTGGSWQSTHSRGAPSILAFSNASRRTPTTELLAYDHRIGAPAQRPVRTPLAGLGGSGTPVGQESTPLVSAPVQPPAGRQSPPSPAARLALAGVTICTVMVIAGDRSGL